MQTITLDINQEEAIVNAIASAELKTSGEIRVHLENKLNGEVLNRAAEVFTMLEMHNTAERNGVLFYIAIDDRKFAVAGDKGINEKVPAAFWDSVRNAVQRHFKQGNFVEGLVEGIAMAGNELAKHFPRKFDDIDELTNDISININ